MYIKVVNSKGEEIKVILSERMMEKIIHLLYPSGEAFNMKGYTDLVNHIRGSNASL